MSYRVASEAYSISVSSIAKRLKGKVRMDASVGAGTVLTLEEENSLEDALIWAAHRHLGVGRLELKQAVTKLCNDGRLVPWDRVNGLGRKWLDLFLRRHPRLSERSCRIYEANRITADDEPRLRSFYANWKELITRLQPQPDHIWNTDETGALTVEPAQRVIAERGQKVVGTKRSNSRENTTVVATINAAGTATPPLIIFKGQRVQAAWLGNGGPPESKFAATDSSFMQGAVFVNYITDFHHFIVKNGLADGKPHILVLDGHASHVNLDVIQLAMTLNIELFQLPSHSSHMTQPLDVAAFGCFKKAVTAVLTSFPLQHGGKMPGKSDMAGVVKDAWAASFTVPQIKASFEGAGLWPVN
ncbi:unnamed protein product, partial [Ascophyllum nodosum]